jgi:hypothetical protein
MQGGHAAAEGQSAVCKRTGSVNTGRAENERRRRAPAPCAVTSYRRPSGAAPAPHSLCGALCGECALMRDAWRGAGQPRRIGRAGPNAGAAAVPAWAASGAAAETAAAAAVMPGAAASISRLVARLGARHSASRAECGGAAHTSSMSQHSRCSCSQHFPCLLAGQRSTQPAADAAPRCAAAASRGRGFPPSSPPLLLSRCAGRAAAPAAPSTQHPRGTT